MTNCFPSDADIFHNHVLWYHEALSTHVCFSSLSFFTPFASLLFYFSHPLLLFYLIFHTLCLYFIVFPAVLMHMHLILWRRDLDEAWWTDKGLWKRARQICALEGTPHQTRTLEWRGQAEHAFEEMPFACDTYKYLHTCFLSVSRSLLCWRKTFRLTTSALSWSSHPLNTSMQIFH